MNLSAPMVNVYQTTGNAITRMTVSTEVMRMSNYVVSIHFSFRKHLIRKISASYLHSDFVIHPSLRRSDN